MRVATMRAGLAALQEARDAAKAPVATPLKKRPKPRPVKVPKDKGGVR